MKLKVSSILLELGTGLCDTLLFMSLVIATEIARPPNEPMETEIMLLSIFIEWSG